MSRLIPLFIMSLAVTACSQRSEVDRQHSAAQINSECKEGRRTGPTCEAASRTLEAAEHRDAQAAFRNMVERN